VSTGLLYLGVLSWPISQPIMVVVAWLVGVLYSQGCGRRVAAAVAALSHDDRAWVWSARGFAVSGLLLLTPSVVFLVCVLTSEYEGLSMTVEQRLTAFFSLAALPTLALVCGMACGIRRSNRTATAQLTSRRPGVR
jgi:hypothetical protein